MHYNTPSIKYTHPSSNNPTFFSAPNPETYDCHDTATSIYALNNQTSLPFPLSRQYSVGRNNGMRLLTDLNSQTASDFGSPSSGSSSSPHMAITPMSLHDDGRTVRVESREDRGTTIEFDGGPRKYVIPNGFPPFAAALECDSAMKYPRQSATPYLTHSTWQFENGNAMCDAWLRAAIQPSPDAVSQSWDARAFHEDTRQQDSLVHVYPQHAYTPPVSALTPAPTPVSPVPSGLPSPVSPPASISSHFSSRSSLFLPPLSSTTSRFACQNPIPLHQPQPIRPIPIIPLSDLSSCVSEDFSTFSNLGHSPPHLFQAHAGSSYDADFTEYKPRASDSHSPMDFLSPFALLYQPVSDAVRYQIRPLSVADTHRTMSGAPSASGDSPDQHYYGNGLPKVFGGFFCACGCLGLKHLQSEWPQS